MKQRLDAARVLDGECEPADAGTYGIGTLAAGLPHIDLFKLHHCDPMHLMQNAGVCILSAFFFVLVWLCGWCFSPV